MEIKKQFKFSGIFRKFHEEDSKPIEISNANILCYTNGHIFLEVNAQVNQYINEKLFFEKSMKVIMGLKVKRLKVGR